MSQDLIKRLEAATGPDRELDGDIMMGMVLVTSDAVRTCDDYFDTFRKKRSDPHPPSIKIPCYTSSIDAAVALAERVLPEWIAHVSTTGRVAIDRSIPHSRYVASAANPALALCIAILKAKEAQDGNL